MSSADNARLQTHAPAWLGLLSELGRRVALPMGIPSQSKEAGKAHTKATIGQLTDDDGNPITLPSIAAHAPGDLGDTFKYAPLAGIQALREAWLDHQRDVAGVEVGGITLPMVTHGLTHGVALTRDLFVDDATHIVLPRPNWENYEHLYGLYSNPTFHFWDLFDDEGRLNLAGFDACLQDTADAPKRIVVLNFPHNPTGYSPTLDEAEALMARIAGSATPTVWLFDDAYQGVVFEDGVQPFSLFWEALSVVDHAHSLVCKVDGATKEFAFFAARVGFITFGAPEAAIPAIESKLLGLIRGHIGSPNGPSQTMLLQALRNLDEVREEQAAVLEQMRVRYERLKELLADIDSPELQVLPFNSGYFAVIRVHGVDADTLRKHLIDAYSVGTIALPDINGIRIAFCSTERLDEVVSALSAAMADLRVA